MSRLIESKLDPRRDRPIVFTVCLQMLDLELGVKATEP